MLGFALSLNGVPIRLPEERWNHVLSEHPELAPYKANVLETIASPNRVLEGDQGELLAVSEVSQNKWLVSRWVELNLR